MMSNPYQQYKEQALSTMSQGELLVKLFDECIKQMLIAKLSIQKKDLGAANDSLSKTQVIVNTLSDSLDMRIPMSKNLRDMYAFLFQTITQINMKKDVAMIDEVMPLFKDLRESFEQAEKASRRGQRVAVGGRAV